MVDGEQAEQEILSYRGELDNQRLQHDKMYAKLFEIGKKLAATEEDQTLFLRTCDRLLGLFKEHGQWREFEDTGNQCAAHFFTGLLFFLTFVSVGIASRVAIVQSTVSFLSGELYSVDAYLSALVSAIVDSSCDGEVSDELFMQDLREHLQRLARITSPSASSAVSAQLDKLAKHIIATTELLLSQMEQRVTLTIHVSEQYNALNEMQAKLAWTTEQLKISKEAKVSAEQKFRDEVYAFLL